MMNAIREPHVYLREIKQDEKTSLSALGDLISFGSTVLDIGCGSGALGRHLKSAHACVVDGLTINEAEAVLARPDYRSVFVVDLDGCDLQSLLGEGHYDFIVCADVLEHLLRPEQVLDACRKLLTPAGKLLVSVPNVAYSGLVAELMQGQFQYREEGLLDRTHIRFFTRDSLQKFLRLQGWQPQSIDVISKNLLDSEFTVPFDSLSPSVARYLLAMPDALTYQFIVVAVPDGDATLLQDIPDRLALEAQAMFSAQLYWQCEGQYSESRKIVRPGVIGQLQQSLKFRIPASEQRITALRLDPADRPGFLHLYGIALVNDDGNVLWRWQADSDGMDTLAGCRQQQIFVSPLATQTAGVLLLLTGDDPWIELPIPVSALFDSADKGSCELVIELGWPMSADYLAMVNAVAGAVPEKNHATSNSSEWISAGSFKRWMQLNERLSDLQERLNREQNKQQLLKDHQVFLKHQNLDLRSQNSDLKSQSATLMVQVDHMRRELRGVQQDRSNLIRHLEWIERSTVFRVTRPLVKMKMRLNQIVSSDIAQRQSGRNHALMVQPVNPQDATVDVVVPVYRNLSDTRRCLHSVLASTALTPYRLIVINDESPEPELTQWLRELATSEDRIVLIENSTNLGFIGTVNRGMALSNNCDVVLLNSDTEVANDWLDRLRDAAYCDTKVGTVTPFSNNATICSFPKFCEVNSLPSGHSTASLDAVFSRMHRGQVIDVPTGVGFCMYIRRDCLQSVGQFDQESFGKGYGEENDFCRRASAKGWRNLHALDTFVLHSGGSSFGDSKRERELAAMDVLRRLYPDYEHLVHQFIEQDPARPYRISVDMALMREASIPSVLQVLHDRAGGTLRHVNELTHLLGGEANFFSLTPIASGVLLKKIAEGASFQQVFRLPQEWDALLDTLRWLSVGLVHYHHILGHDPLVLGLAERLDVPYDLTVHDYYLWCPQITLTDHTNRYCGELGVAQCTRCLQRSPAPDGIGIQDWRDRHAPLVRNARNVLVPGRDAGRRFASYYPTATVRLAPHTDMQASQGPVHTVAPVRVNKLHHRQPLKIAVIGALSSIKGADVLESVAIQARKLELPLEFHLLGYGYRHLKTQPKAALTVHGAYDDEDLSGLLEWLNPDLIWFTAQWPETYSYTLSAALQSNRPLVVPELGAFSHRIAGHLWAWVCPWNMTAEEWVAFFGRIRTAHFLTGTPPAQAMAPAAVGEDMAIQTNWSYKEDYLRDVSFIVPQGPMPKSILSRQASVPSGGVLAVQSRFKKLILTWLVYLRSSPVLARLASRIPLRLQTRLKSWLRS